MPGFTGLPRDPRKETSTPLELSSASSPPTTYRLGHVIRYSTCGRGAPPPIGTTTHGPAFGTQTMRPSHSRVAPAGATPTMRAAATTTPTATTALTGLSGRGAPRARR